MSYKEIMRDYLSMEDGVERESVPDLKESGGVSIDLSDYEEDTLGLNKIVATLNSAGLRVNRDYSPESVINLTKNEFNPNTVILMDKASQTDGNDNLIVNGEYLPDLINQIRIDTPVKVISPKSVLSRLDDDLIYYIVDDKSNVVYKHLKSEGMYVASEPLELAEVIEKYRHEKIRAN